MSTPSDDEIRKIRLRAVSDPTDLQYRFNLGVALFSRHDYTEAIPELARAMVSPPLRLRAMALIAEAFDAKGMRDLAAHMRERISRESGDDGDAGSAPLPVPTKPLRPFDSSGATQIPNQDDNVG